LSTLDSDTGGGACQFTVRVDGSSITFGGFTLVISGGSNINTGITGAEVALLPVDENVDAFTGDFFFQADGYQAFLSGVILVCEVIQG
jgi:hypothetical protein